MEMNHEILMQKHGVEGKRFQSALAEFILKHKLTAIVETGSGVSSLYILKSLDALDEGCLYSIDPLPFCGFEISHTRYTLIKKKSFQSLAKLYQQIGVFDLFLHDSDHWIECQMYEYEMAYACLKQGGWVFSDDYEWDGHFAWKRFCEKYKLKDITVGNIRGAQKKDSFVIDKKDVQRFSLKTWAWAKAYGEKWRKENDRPECWTCGNELTEYWKFPETIEAL